MGSSKKKDKKKKKTKSKDRSSSDKKNDLSNESLATTTKPPSSSHSEKSNTSLSSAVVKIEKSTGTTPSSPSQKIQLQPSSNQTQQVSQFIAWGQAFQAAASIIPHDLGDDYVDPSTTTLQELDRDGNVKEKWGSGNILGVSRIAVECMTKKKEHQVQEKGKKRGLEDVTDAQKETIDNMNHGDARCELEQNKPAKKSKKKHKKEKKKKGDKVKDEEGKGITTHDQDSTTDEIIPDDNGNPELEGKMITHQGQPMMVLVDNVKKVVYSGLDRSEDGNLIQIGLVHEDTIKIDIAKEIPTKPIVTEQGTFQMSDGDNDNDDDSLNLITPHACIEAG